MTEQLYLLQKHFDTAMESPDGIKKLRELILTLAMHGKLVKQDSKDQPASKLLKEIQAEKERLIKEGKIKKQKELPPIKPEEVPYEVPEGWEWVRLSEIVDVGTGSTPTTTNHEYYNGTIPWYTSSATNNPMAAEPGKFITEKAIYETNCKVFPTGSLIIALYGQGKTRGQISEIVIPGATNQAIAAMIFYESSRHIKLYLKYFFFKIYAEIRLLAAGAAQPNLNVGKIKATLIPIPPLAEQKRIVVKIDELMALCDRLEAQRKARNDKRLAVHTAAINGLLTAADKKEFDTSWQFIARHFDPLYSVKENVAELKKAILTLAMQGKLVKQDPKDQPAIELLKEIQAEKERLIKKGKIKKQKELPPIKSEEVLYEVPDGWVWTRLGDIGETNIGLTYSPADISDIGIPVLRSNNVQDGKLDLSNLVRVNKEIKDSVIVNEGDLLICARNGSRALVGKTAQIIGLNEKMAFGAFMAVLRSRGDFWGRPLYIKLTILIFFKLLELYVKKNESKCSWDFAKCYYLLSRVFEQRQVVGDGQ
ncbi:MAG: restriction endonuclease subunit S [Desulfobacterium sp.]|nr:restriction endonuclease subunit S [Desulfobacterium sp.]MBU3950384.1 restriction endonuclease subunit S [Pseudomonadota bacterium]MBU4010602.1 restriction endonuclease subunit S [Pseudomonadota bacterium]MBU4035033.1 restriction endonuclease subunit S [Pseudomonadota bacterium]